jgi:hypothetical protein
MKRIALTIALMGLLAGGALFAEGVQEDGTDAARPYYSGETVSVEGSVKLSAGRPELTASDGTTYELMYPYFLAEGVELSDGDRVKVEGFLIPGPRWQEDDDERHLRVEKAEVNGESYDLTALAPAYSRRAHGPQGYGPGGAYGHMGGRRGGRMGGPGGGMQPPAYGNQGYGNPGYRQGPRW